MEIIMAIIKPYKLDDVRDALNEIGVEGLTVSEVQGYGRQRGHTEIYRGAEYEVNFIPKLKLELVVNSDKTDDVVVAIQRAAKTDKIGDGKIFTLPVSQAVRIRTGESGGEAL